MAFVLGRRAFDLRARILLGELDAFTLDPINGADMDAVGAAAGVIISTPIAVVDPQTRDNLDSQIKSMTGTPGGAATPRWDSA